MLLIVLSMALTNAQQTQHDLTEWKMYQRMQGYQAEIADIWRPSDKLLADYSKAKKCYVRFHLYRTTDCSVELHNVEVDLGNVEVARTEGR